MVDSSEFPRAEFLCNICAFYWNILVVICRCLSFISNYSKRLNCIVLYCHFLECIVICIVSSNLPMHRNMMNRFTPNKYKYKFIQKNWSFEIQIHIFCSALIQIQIHRFKYRYKYVQPNISAEVYPLHFRKFHWHWSSCGTWWGGTRLLGRDAQCRPLTRNAI